jgi:glycosyltransferase involved in cell wall biosynthesis
MNPANLVAIWAKRLSRTSTRVVVSIRSTLSERLRGERDLRVRLIARLFGPAYRHHADAVVAVSHGVADDFSAMTGLPRARISVIYNPVVSDELWAKAREPLNHPSFASGGPPIVLAAGRLDPAKDFPTLIRAFARVRDVRPGRLVILGEGSERPRLEALIADLRLTGAVTLLGFVLNPYPYMGAADLFVLSSRREGLPNSLIEAMALGTPVISTDCPSGPREILENGKWGGLVPVGDVDALATAMIHALDRPGVDPSPRGLEFTVERAVRQYAQVAGLAALERS